MTDIPKSLTPRGLDGAEWEVLWCLFKQGATWDGGIPSKSGRDRLISQGLAYREDGWTILTIDGFRAALAAGMDRKKGTN